MTDTILPDLPVPSPEQPPPTGRDAKGLFQRGHKLGGRPRGVDIRAAFIATHGEESAERACSEVMAAMVARAKQGDPQAAKIVLDRLAGPVVAQIEAALATDGLTDAERVSRIESLLAVAALRRRGDDV